MKKIITIVFIAISSVCNATNYYFSETYGDDSRTSTQAQNQNTPWKSLSKLNSFFSSLLPGDSILLRANDVFFGSITVNKSGNFSSRINISRYGTGFNPVVTGFYQITSWVYLGNNIWESSIPVSTLSTCNIASIKNVNFPQGRFPNSGYFSIPSTNGSTTITDGSNINSFITNWTGGQVVIRELMYQVNKHNIISTSGSTITFDAGSVPVNWGYFIQNHIKACDTQNEWYYNSSTKKFGIYSVDSPLNVKIPIIDQGVNLNGKDYITIDNVDFSGFNSIGINTNSRTGINIQSCNISFIGVDGVYGYPNSPNLYITNSNFTDCNSRSINAGASGSCYIYNNKIIRTGHFSGMGTNGDNSYTGIVAIGDNSQIIKNYIDSSGYCGIRSDGNNTLIEKNFVRYCTYIKDDGGNIYLYPNNLGNVPQHFSTRTIRDNTCLEAIGAPLGSPYGKQGGLIYLDGQSPDVRVIHNSLYKATYGIFVNGGNNIFIDSNTVHDATNCLLLQKIGGPIFGETVTHNIFSSLTGSSSCGSGQYSAVYKPDSSSMHSSFLSDYNCYSRPLYESVGWIYSDFGSGVCNNVSQWQTLSGQDSHSKKSFKTITSQDSIKFVYNETSSSKIIPLSGQWREIKDSSYYNGSITVPANSSYVLLKHYQSVSSGGGGENPVPVSTIDVFNASVSPLGEVILSWTGTFSNNTKNFFVKKKVRTSFSNIYTINYNKKILAFKYKIKENSGTYQYQIQVNDIDGKVNNSKILSVNVRKKTVTVIN